MRNTRANGEPIFWLPLVLRGELVAVEVDLVAVLVEEVLDVVVPEGLPEAVAAAVAVLRELVVVVEDVSVEVEEASVVVVELSVVLVGVATPVPV